MRIDDVIFQAGRKCDKRSIYISIYVKVFVDFLKLQSVMAEPDGNEQHREIEGCQQRSATDEDEATTEQNPAASNGNVKDESDVESEQAPFIAKSEETGKTEDTEDPRSSQNSAARAIVLLCITSLTCAATLPFSTFVAGA